MKVKCDKEGIIKASKIIKHGGIVIFPTDTVYGIGCDPYNKEAVQRIYKIKSRLISKQLPILALSKDIAAKIVEFDKDSEKIANFHFMNVLYFHIVAELILAIEKLMYCALLQ